jgi:hypothetical protein
VAAPSLRTREAPRPNGSGAYAQPTEKAAPNLKRAQAENRRCGQAEPRLGAGSMAAARVAGVGGAAAGLEVVA